ncbi:MAG: hypothetical protein COB85_08780 [Bacteroidetes bacterium]|nr:MAG: hypothetical protein COB85_08780 [Bacteroidota bacterium]
MSIRRYFIALLFSLSAITAQAQSSRIVDSLKSVIIEAEHDTSVCNAYLIWGEQVYMNNPDSALILFQKSHDLAEKNLTVGHQPTLQKKYLWSLAEAQNNIGYIYNSQGNMPKALEYYLKSLKIKEEIGNSSDEALAKAGKKGIANSINNIGVVYLNQGNIPQALEYFRKSLVIREEIGDKEGMAISLNSIGLIYKSQGDIIHALKYLHKSLAIQEELGNKSGIATSLINIASIYKNQGDITQALENYHKSLAIREEIGYKRGIASSLNSIGFIHKSLGDITQALGYYHKSLAIREEIGDKRGIAVSLNNIGFIHKKQGDIPQALEHYGKSLAMREEIGDKRGIANSLNHMGFVYQTSWRELGMSEWDALIRAKQFGERGLQLAQEAGSPNRIKASASLLSLVAKQQGNLTTGPVLRQARFKEALDMFELHVQMRDSMKNEETQKSTIRQQTKYEFEKAQLVNEQEEKEAARLNAEETSRRDNLQYSVILIAILVLFGGVLSLGFVNVSERTAEGIIFFSFLILFEFFLVLADPYIDGWSGGAPGIKLLFNAGIAALIFPLHSFFESKMKGRLMKHR